MITIRGSRDSISLTVTHQAASTPPLDSFQSSTYEDDTLNVVHEPIHFRRTTSLVYKGRRGQGDEYVVDLVSHQDFRTVGNSCRRGCCTGFQDLDTEVSETLGSNRGQQAFVLFGGCSASAHPDAMNVSFQLTSGKWSEGIRML